MSPLISRHSIHDAVIGDDSFVYFTCTPCSCRCYLNTGRDNLEIRADDAAASPEQLSAAAVARIDQPLLQNIQHFVIDLSSQ